jgi:transposase
MANVYNIQSDFLAIIAALQRSLVDAIQDDSLEVHLRRDSQLIASRLDLIVRARENYNALTISDNNAIAKLNAIINEILGNEGGNTMIDEQRYNLALSKAKELRSLHDKLQAQVEELKAELAKEELDDEALLAQANSISEKATALMDAVLDSPPVVEPTPATPEETVTTSDSSPVVETTPPIV